MKSIVEKFEQTNKIKKREFFVTGQIIKFIGNSRHHKLKRKNNEEHHNDTLSKIYIDRMIAKERKTTIN
jgi:hypothetical protein